MGTTPVIWSLAVTLLSAPAWAGTCDRHLKSVEAKEGDALVATFRDLAACDLKLAEENFPRFTKAAGDVETVVPLALAAIDADAYTAVWELMDRVPYEHRGAIARGVGEACEDQAEVVVFLKGAYAGLKGTEFASWQPALEVCDSDAMMGWLEEVVTDPPRSSYNEKYNAVLTAFAKTRKADALPSLEAAAVAAGQRGGPFNNILDTVQRSIQPDDFKQDPAPEDVEAMEQLLVRVASAVPPESARLVSDRLYTAGNEALAASLLPALYPNRVQAGGEMMWAGAAVEACDGQAIIHWVVFTEAPTRLDMVEAVSAPLRGTKARLKCTADGDWPVVAANEPLQGMSGAEAWIAERVTAWTDKGFKVKAQQEKKLAIP